MQEKILPILKNKYIIILLIAGAWMLFFDRYNLVAQRNVRQEIHNLRADKQLYEEGIERLDEERMKLSNDLDRLEYFAREHYWMKKKHEDVFIVTED